MQQKDDASTLTSVMEQLVSMEGSFEPKMTKYICHNSTIPLATAFDINRDRNNYELFDWAIHKDCNVGACMFANSKKETSMDFIDKQCPCNKYRDKNVPYICWNTLMKRLKSQLNPQGTIDPKEVMFCFDQRGILEENYPTLMRQKTSLKGFEEVETPPQLINLLLETYWYCKYEKQYKLNKQVTKLYEFVTRNSENKKGIAFRNTIRSIMGTINGLIVKKSLILSRECTSYKQLNQQIAAMFNDLCIEHSIEIREQLPEETASLFEEAKIFFKFVKSSFNHENKEVRERIFNYEFRNKSLKKFFGYELSRLGDYATRQVVMGRGDYTTSLSWCHKMAHLSQTRTLDHVPEFLEKEQMSDYIKLMTRDLEDPGIERMQIVHTAMVKHLKDKGIKSQFLNDYKVKEELIKDSILLELKGTASAENNVYEGGKLEDARLLLKDIRDNKWRIPIRDLDDFSIIGQTPEINISTWSEEGIINLSSVIFWTSLQISLNLLCAHDKMPEEFYYPLYKDGKEWLKEDLFNATLIGIKEPGKLRLLIKMMSILNWTLSVGSKLLQKVLAELPDHKAGLELGSQDWNFSKRISGESPESGFLYTLEGILKEKAHFGYTDWSTATDLIMKRLGFQGLKTFISYVGFPDRYGQLILELTRLPLEVKEVAYIANGEITNRYESNYIFKEGFPMGLQVTKTYLHLAHIISDGVSSMYLEEKGFAFSHVRSDRRTFREGLISDKKLEKLVPIY